VLLEQAGHGGSEAGGVDGPIDVARLDDVVGDVEPVVGNPCRLLGGPPRRRVSAGADPIRSASEARNAARSGAPSPTTTTLQV
jgi:hypothetical protein